MHLFQLHRDEDQSGVSGTGIVAEGVLFQSGKVVLSWLTENTSLGIYDSAQIMEIIHGHGGKTRVVWLDGPQVDQSEDHLPGEPIAWIVLNLYEEPLGTVWAHSEEEALRDAGDFCERQFLGVRVAEKQRRQPMPNDP